MELIKNVSTWFGLNVAICYFYNVLGPGQLTSGTHATVIGIFEEQKKKNLALTVVSPGTQTRAFTHNNDVARGLVAVGHAGKGDGYFLGSDVNISIIEVAAMFGVEYKIVPERVGERISSDVKPSRARSELGWKPGISLKQYLNNLQ